MQGKQNKIISKFALKLFAIEIFTCKHLQG